MSMTVLEENLRYTFTNPNLLTQALTHSSYASEHHAADNERLEFLGDSLLEVIVSSYLFINCPDLSEGGLSKIRGKIVSTRNLYKIAQKFNLGEYLLLGKGEEQTKGRERESNLVNALEAVIGAVFLDSQYETTQKVVLDILEGEIEDGFSIDNYKGKLQETCQKYYQRKPVYRVVSSKGLEHKKIFTVEVTMNAEVIGSGMGRNKKEAQQVAAKEALERIGRNREEFSDGACIC